MRRTWDFGGFPWRGKMAHVAEGRNRRNSRSASTFAGPSPYTHSARLLIILRPQTSSFCSSISPYLATPRAVPRAGSRDHGSLARLRTRQSASVQCGLVTPLRAARLNPNGRNSRSFPLSTRIGFLRTFEQTLITPVSPRRGFHFSHVDFQQRPIFAPPPHVVITFNIEDHHGSRRSSERQRSRR